MKPGLGAVLRGNVLWLSVVSLLNDTASEMIYPLLPWFLVGTLGATPAFLGVIEGVAEGNRARLKGEACAGLAGLPLSEGLPGQWVQPYWLWLTVNEAGGALTVQADEGRVVLSARMPN